jgi:hypothetical protein
MTLSPLGTFGIGQYTSTYNSVTLGLTTSEGFRVRYRPSIEAINDTNLYGDCLIDGIYRGITGVQLVATFMEWKADVTIALWPYGANAAFDGTLGTIGTLQSSFAKTMVLSAVSGTPAYTNGPVTLTALGAILSADNDIEILMGPTKRNIPIVFDLLLTATSGTGGVPGFFAVT